MRLMIAGKQLLEGVDYTVDYQSREIRIVNPSLKGGKYTVSYENQNNFLSLECTFLGLNIDHHFSKNFNLGAMLVNYLEKPLTQKVQYNHEALNNTIFRLHTTYTSSSLF